MAVRIEHRHAEADDARQQRIDDAGRAALARDWPSVLAATRYMDKLRRSELTAANRAPAARASSVEPPMSANSRQGVPDRAGSLGRLPPTKRPRKEKAGACTGSSSHAPWAPAFSSDDC